MWWCVLRLGKLFFNLNVKNVCVFAYKMRKFPQRNLRPRKARAPNARTPAPNVLRTSPTLEEKPPLGERVMVIYIYIAGPNLFWKAELQRIFMVIYIYIAGP